MREFTDFEKARKALGMTPGSPYEWLVEPIKWRLRKKTREELLEQIEYSSESVEVRFQTTADLQADTLTEEDLIGLGKFVVEIAADERTRR